MVLRKNILITGVSAGLGEGTHPTRSRRTRTAADLLAGTRFRRGCSRISSELHSMARQFAARGRNLALCARLDELAAELKAAYPGITVVTRGLDVNEHDRVFAAFDEFRAALGSLDRVIVNAGIGKGQPVGSGRFDVNRQTPETDFAAGAAQIEAAAGIFREQRGGHLAVVSPVAALRGMPKNAAAKAGLSTFVAGTRMKLRGAGTAVTDIRPGHIRSEMYTRSGGGALATSAEAGARAPAKAVEAEPKVAYVPPRPWIPRSVALRLAPGSVLRRFV